VTLIAACRVGLRGALLLGLALGSAQACREDKVNMKNEPPAQSISHDEATLRSHLSLPGAPLEVSFEQLPRGTPGGLGPTDYVLVALLRFDKPTLAHLAETSQPRPGNPPRISLLADRPWFPAPVRAAIEGRDGTGVSIRGRKFDATPLLKSPYSTGYFVLVEGTDYVILSAQTS
jgi:hypothetical protein